MSSRVELFGKWDIKIPQYLHMDIRTCVTDMYQQVEVLRGAMKAQLDCAEFFGEYFEQFETEYVNLLTVISFLHEIHVLNDGTFSGVQWKLDEILQEVMEMYKQVYNKVE